MYNEFIRPWSVNAAHTMDAVERVLFIHDRAQLFTPSATFIPFNTNCLCFHYLECVFL